MRHQLLSALALLVLATSTAYAQQAIFLIRHSEQVLDVEDPPLTEKGLERAKRWAAILREADIRAIYTSDTVRTQQTGEAIAKELAVQFESIPRRDVTGLVKRVHEHDANEAVLIVSHTLTIPKLVEALAHSEDGVIEREDYGTLFVIVPTGVEDATLLRLRHQ